MSSDVAVATWNLRPTKQKAAESFLDTSPTLPHSGGETSLNGDTRKIVPQAYRQPKGRYYCEFGRRILALRCSIKASLLF